MSFKKVMTKTGLFWGLTLALSVGIWAMEPNDSSSSSDDNINLKELTDAIGSGTPLVSDDEGNLDSNHESDSAHLRLISKPIKFPDYLSSGTAPTNCFNKLTYLMEQHTDSPSDALITFVDKYLNLAEYFFCCPSFLTKGGLAQYYALIDLYDLEERSWPWSKMTVGIGIALFYDKYVYLLIGGATIFGVGYNWLWGNSGYDDLVHKINTTSYFPGCTRCKEFWRFPFNQDPLVAPIHLYNYRLGMWEVLNADRCPGLKESAPSYVEMIMHNVTWNDHVTSINRPGLGSFTFTKSLDFFNSQRFHLWGYERPDNLDVYQCNFVKTLRESIQIKNPFSADNAPLTVVASTVTAGCGAIIGFGRFWVEHLLSGNKLQGTSPDV